MASPKSQQLAAIREVVSSRLSESELRTLCFDLGIDYESLGGMTKPDKVRELLLYAYRRGEVHTVVARVLQLRPDIYPDDLELPEGPEPRNWVIIAIALVALIAIGLTITSILRIAGSQSQPNQSPAPTLPSASPIPATNAIAVAATEEPSALPPSPVPTTLAQTCFAELVADLPDERIVPIVVGETDYDVSYSLISPTDPTPLVVRLIDKGKTVALIRLFINRPAVVTQVDRIMDSDCNEVTTYHNGERPSNLGTFENNEHLEIRIGDQLYVLSLNYRATAVRFWLMRR